MSGKHNNSENLGAYYESILEKEVRKRDGIYYSPSPVVDYIIDETIGKLFKDKTERESGQMNCMRATNFKSGRWSPSVKHPLPTWEKTISKEEYL